jgi:hypothetical protein
MKDWGFDMFLIRLMVSQKTFYDLIKVSINRVRELRIKMQNKTRNFGGNTEHLEDVKEQPVLHAHTIA